MAADPDRSFTLPQVAAVADVEYRTLHLWLRRGILTATKQAAAGSGSANIFDFGDALLARILGDLRRAGLEMHVLERVAAELRRQGRRPTGAELLLVNGRVELVGRSDDVRNRLTAAGTTVVYDTCDARTAVERMLAASE
jgi:DNA-binding transcriptional MerR regulator